MKQKKIIQAAKKGPQPEAAPSKAIPTRLPAMALLVLVCVVVYYNMLSNGFAFDDFGSIVNNPYLKQPGQFLASLFNLSYFKVAGLEASYRPVATLSYFLIYCLAGLDPFYYHLLSLVLHALATVLVYRLADAILENHFTALLAGLLFAVHPALTEAVDCISFNDDLLAGIFFLAALLSYIKIKADSAAVGSRNYWLALIFYFLGLLSKEMAITLPAIVVLYDLVLADVGHSPLTVKHLFTTLKKRLTFYAGFAVVSIVYLWLRFFILVTPGGYQQFSYGRLLERIIYLPGHLFSFVKLAIFPYPLSPDYVFSYPNSFLDSSNLIGLAVVTGLIAASFVIYRYSKAISFGIWWFFITLMPVANLIEIYNPIAERYLYIPIIGFCLVVPAAVNGLARKWVSRPRAATTATLIPLVGISFVYAAVSMARNPDWQNNFVLWSKTVRTMPNSPLAHGNLGREYQDQGRFDEAQKQFEIAIGLDPRDFKSYYNLGLVYYQKGDPVRAVQYFKRALAIYPNFFSAHYNLALLYHKQGQLDLAIEHYLKLIAIKPQNFVAHYNLGLAYAMQGKLTPAIAQWEIARRIDPQNSAVIRDLNKARKMLQNSNSPN